MAIVRENIEYLKGREEAEKDMLLAAGGKAFVEANNDWDAILCEWKIANMVLLDNFKTRNLGGNKKWEKRLNH